MQIPVTNCNKLVDTLFPPFGRQVSFRNERQVNQLIRAIFTPAAGLACTCDQFGRKMRLIFNGFNVNLVASNCFQLRKQLVTRNFSTRSKMDYLLALDFEATCDSGKTKFAPQEIIEFPAILAKCDDLKVQDTFCKFVRPVHRPQLTSFCTSLTAITQETVDMSQPFPVVWRDFTDWLKLHQLIDDEMNAMKKFTFVTCGNWDLGVMFPDQCSLSNITVPEFMKRWINIKSVFRKITGRWPRHLSQMLDELNIKPVGRLHSGQDDALNVLFVMRELVRRGAQIESTDV